MRWPDGRYGHRHAVWESRGAFGGLRHAGRQPLKTWSVDGQLELSTLLVASNALSPARESASAPASTPSLPPMHTTGHWPHHMSNGARVLWWNSNSPPAVADCSPSVARVASASQFVQFGSSPGRSVCMRLVAVHCGHLQDQVDAEFAVVKVPAQTCGQNTGKTARKGRLSCSETVHFFSKTMPFLAAAVRRPCQMHPHSFCRFHAFLFCCLALPLCIHSGTGD